MTVMRETSDLFITSLFSLYLFSLYMQLGNNMKIEKLAVAERGTSEKQQL